MRPPPGRSPGPTGSPAAAVGRPRRSACAPAKKGRVSRNASGQLVRCRQASLPAGCRRACRCPLRQRATSDSSRYPAHGRSPLDSRCRCCAGSCRLPDRRHQPAAAAARRPRLRHTTIISLVMRVCCSLLECAHAKPSLLSDDLSRRLCSSMQDEERFETLDVKRMTTAAIREAGATSRRRPDARLQLGADSPAPAERQIDGLDGRRKTCARRSRERVARERAAFRKCKARCRRPSQRAASWAAAR